jgi:hypothetical protein
MFHPPGSQPQPGMGAFPPDWMALHLHAGRGAPRHHATGAGRLLAALWRAAGRRPAAPCAGHAAAKPGPARRAGPDHHHRGRHARARHREPHAAEAGRLCDGGGAGLGGRVRPARRHGHAHPAGATRPGRARPGGDGALLRGARAQAVRERERVAQPDRLQPLAGQRTPRAAAGGNGFYVVGDDTYGHIAPDTPPT